MLHQPKYYKNLKLPARYLVIYIVVTYNMNLWTSITHENTFYFFATINVKQKPIIYLKVSIQAKILL